MSDRRQLVVKDHPNLSIARQCELLGLPRSSWYYQPATDSDTNLSLMRLIDKQFTETPFFGRRMMTNYLRRCGHAVNEKRIGRLMKLMGLASINPGPRTTRRTAGHKIYPYLLRRTAITRPNQVWACDITYIPMRRGFLYLTAIMDWWSRYVLSWRLSNTMSVEFCMEALAEALLLGTPEIFNTDQGSQFTSDTFTSLLLQKDIAISMTGRGRALDNVVIERLWRTVKYEHVYTHDYTDGHDAERKLTAYFEFYCEERVHSSLSRRTPGEVYRGEKEN